MDYALISRSTVPIYTLPGTKIVKEGRSFTAIADEGLYGMGVRITGEEQNGYLPILTHYGYPGYICAAAVIRKSIGEMKSREAQPLCVVDAIFADVTNEPSVNGVILTSLPKGALVQLNRFDTGTAWAEISLLDGQHGYIRKQFLQEKVFSQCGLWETALPQRPAIMDEASFRSGVVNEAKKYLGVQYRWGGKSTLGLDCSGLTSMCYMLQGALIYRDACIEPGYPIREIPLADKLPGDLLYFPGHIVLYMGDGRYIHSTGLEGSGGVVINSLDPGANDYRADLAENIYAAGSLFAGEEKL